MAFQIRAAAVFRSVNFFTGLTPGRLFQTSTTRTEGQLAASSARSLWLPKRSALGAPSAACFCEAQALMLLVSSIVKVFILLSPCRGLAAVITFIALVGETSKSILERIRN